MMMTTTTIFISLFEQGLNGENFNNNPKSNSEKNGSNVLRSFIIIKLNKTISYSLTIK